MKNYFSLILILFAFTGKGQDSAKLSRHSVSFTAGVNINYPGINQYTEGGWFQTVIVPSSSAQPWAELKYNMVFHQTENYSIGMNVGIGFAQNVYKGTADEYGEVALYKTLPAYQRTDNVEINTGFFINEKLGKKIHLYNEIGFYGSIQVYQYYQLLGPNPSLSYPPYPNNNYPLLDLTNTENVNVFLFYQTGVAITISKNLTLTPTIQIPLFNITCRSYTWNKAFDNNAGNNLINAYNSIRTGVMLTYNFSRK